MGIYESINVKHLIEERHANEGEKWIGISPEDFCQRYGKDLIGEIQHILDTKENKREIFAEVNALHKKAEEELSKEDGIDISEFNHQMGNILNMLYIKIDDLKA